MTEEGRRFTIERIDKYREEVDKTNNSIAFKTIKAGISAIIIIFTFSGAILSLVQEEIILGLTTSILASLNGYTWTIELIDIIKAISRKTGIEINMNALKDRLLEEGIDYDAIKEEEKGKSI